METVHHHNLTGLFINQQEYTVVELDIKPREQGDSDIKINLTEISEKARDDIKFYIKHDLQQLGLYSKSNTFYVFLQLAEIPAQVSTKLQITKTNIVPNLTNVSTSNAVAMVAGGVDFPLSNRPYLCPDDLEYRLDWSGVTPVYSEPKINFIERLLRMIPGRKTYETLIVAHNKLDLSERYYPAFELLTKENFENNTYKAVILRSHLVKHKYAHNGFAGEENVDKLVSKIRRPPTVSDYQVYQYIHSLCHLFDLLYMCRQKTRDFIQQIECLEKLNNNILSEHHRQCINLEVSREAGSFLKIGTDGKYILPYSITDTAMRDKKRQYLSKTGSLIPSFASQILHPLFTVPIEGSTRDLPNSEIIDQP